MVYKLYEFDVGVASCLLSLCYFRHEAVKFCLLCCCMNVGIINSADFEDGAGGSVSFSLCCVGNWTAQRKIPIQEDVHSIISY